MHISELIRKLQQMQEEHGDLSENAEYHEARTEQSFNEGRILEIENTFKNAEVAEQNGGRGVQIGSKVNTKVGDSEKEFVIVGTNEGNPIEGLISCDSPLGQSLLNKEVGETAEVETPKGKMKYKIISIK